MEKSKTKKTLQIVLNVIIWLFVIFAVVITILVIAAQSDSDGVPAIGGKCYINIVTPSMSPTINEGDMVVGEKLTDEQKRQLVAQDKENGIEGDIITFKADLFGDGTQSLNTHRIIRVNRDADGNVISYVTKGDNNAAEDRNTVSWEKVICRYTGTRFKAVGGVLSFLQTSTGFLIVIVIPLILFFLYELYKFIVTLKTVRGGGKKVISAQDEELIKQKAIEEYLRQQAEAKAAEEAQKKTNDVETAAEEVENKTEEAAVIAEETVEEVKSETEEVAETAEEAIAEAEAEAEETVETVGETAEVTIEEIEEQTEEAAVIAEEAIEEIEGGAADADPAEAAEEKTGE